MRCVQSTLASLTVCLEARPRHQALRQPRSPGPSRSTMAFFLSWRTSPPDLRRRPSSCHGGLPLHPAPAALQTPGTVSESAFSSAGRSQGLREGAPDTRLAPLSLSSPVQGWIVQYLVKRRPNGRCSDIEYLPKCPDGCSQGQHLRWCPAIALDPRNTISTFLRA